MNERRNRLTATATAAFLRELAQMRVLVDRSTDETDILSLARRHRLSVYDASYLELAHRDGIPLATLDKQLEAAALATGVNLLGSGSS